MKKNISFCLLLIMISTISFGQNFRFGLTFSPQFNWLKAEASNIDKDGMRFGFQYGLLMDFSIKDNERYAISTGFLINHSGGKTIGSFEEGTATAYTLKTNAKLQYIDIPLTVKLKTNEVNYMTYYGLIGVTPSFAIRARGDKVYEPDPDMKSFENEKIGGDIGFANVSLTVGAGVEYSLSENTSVVGGLYFNNGFINIVQDEDDERTTLNQFGIRIGVLF